MKKRVLIMMLAVVTALGMCVSMTGCGGDEGKGGTAKITIVQQYGMAYAPFQIMEKKGLVETAYEEATGETVEVEYAQLGSGGTINDSFASGDVQVGAMGVAPAITGVMSGAGYKIFSNVSAQPHKIMTSNPNAKSLKDIGEDQIALVNIGSIQHILLAMACEAEMGDAHAMDNNIAAMAHPDGMAALINGTVKYQLTTSPYVYKEAEQGMTELEAIGDVWPEGNSFIVAVASQELYDDNPELYQAVVDSLAEAIDYINNNKEEVAELLCEAEDVSAETMLKWLNDPACSYSTELKGVMTMAEFMDENGFLEVDGPKSISDLAFDNVKGE